MDSSIDVNAVNQAAQETLSKLPYTVQDYAQACLYIRYALDRGLKVRILC